MIKHIRVIPKAGRNLVKEENGRLKVYLTQSPQDGLANAALIELLAKHFNTKKYLIKIIRGQKSRDKIVEIDA